MFHFVSFLPTPGSSTGPSLTWPTTHLLTISPFDRWTGPRSHLLSPAHVASPIDRNDCPANWCTWPLLTLWPLSHRRGSLLQPFYLLIHCLSKVHVDCCMEGQARWRKNFQIRAAAEEISQWVHERQTNNNIIIQWFKYIYRLGH